MNKKIFEEIMSIKTDKFNKELEKELELHFGNGSIQEEPDNDDIEEIIVNNYLELSKYVAKKMRLKNIGSFEIQLDEYDEIELYAVTKNEKIHLDLYSISNKYPDLVEKRMEIECLYADGADKEKVIQLLNTRINNENMK